MKTVAVVQARLGSIRLPAKAFLDVGGQPMVARVLDRAREIKGVDEVILAVPISEVRSFAAVVPKVRIIGGSAVDVLERYAKAALFSEADAIVRLTADCPMLDPEESGRLVAAFLMLSMDFADNVSALADGLDTEIFTTALLRRAAAEAIEPYDREHVTPWIKRNAYRRLYLPARPLPRKVSVDTAEDLEYVRSLLGVHA